MRPARPTHFTRISVCVTGATTVLAGGGCGLDWRGQRFEGAAKCHWRGLRITTTGCTKRST
eukprot:7392634-Lingulodinium_polyedra.AAC.1